MAHWMSIEVFDGEYYPAASWADAWGDRLVEAALADGAVDWTWHPTTWGVVFEVAFDDGTAWERFRDALAVQTALDAVPNPVNGVLIYRGRGGSSGATRPRRPRPLAGAGAAALPVPIEEVIFEAPLPKSLTDTTPVAAGVGGRSQEVVRRFSIRSAILAMSTEMKMPSASAHSPSGA